MPIQTRSAEELSERARFFKHLLDLTTASRAMRGAELLYHNAHPDQLAHVYYALHDSYKAMYVKDKHLTDAAKRAAITCASVIAVAPIHRNPDSNSAIIPVPLDEEEDKDYPNPFLAVRCACAIINHPFHKRTWDDRRRAYCSYIGLSFPSVEPILVEARKNNGVITTNWPIVELSPTEEATLNLMVNDFQIYSYLKQRDEWDLR